jgi:hypothetical protein
MRWITSRTRPLRKPANWKPWTEEFANFVIPTLIDHMATDNTYI